MPLPTFAYRKCGAEMRIIAFITEAPAVHNIQNCAGKPTVAKSALRFSDCSTATSPKGSPRP